MTATTTHLSPAVQLFEIWSTQTAQVLGQIGGASFPCSIFLPSPEGMPPAAASDLWVIATFSGALRGEMSLRLPAASVAPLAQLFMGETMGETPAPGSVATAEHGEAVVELLRQVGGLVATEIKATWGEAQLHVEASASVPSWSASVSAWLCAEKENATPLWIELNLSAALVATLRPEKAEAATAKPAPELARPEPPRPESAPPNPQQESVKLDLLLDVELGVVLRFGARRLLLREVLELTPGAVLELDRQVQEPVDVLLDGRMIARGEVVVLDGHYGLRVTEVAPEI